MNKIALGLGAVVAASALIAASAHAQPTACPHEPVLPPPKGDHALTQTLAPVDTSAAHVISPDPARQIVCGKTALTVTDDIVFARPKLAGGETLNLSMDIIRPSAPGRRPLVVFVPGGGFLVSPKQNALDLRTYVAEAGFVVASIQYRTASNGATYRDGVADLKAAIRYLRAHADDYGVDPAHVAIWGESSGSLLAAIAGLTGDSKAFDTGDNPDQSSRVQAVVDKIGVSDFAKVGDDFDAKAKIGWIKPSPMSGYVGGVGPDGRLIDKNASPLTYVSAAAPPFLLMHGDNDHVISASQSVILHQALRRAGAKSTLYVLHGADHGDLSMIGDFKAGLVWSSAETMDIIVGFLKQHLAPNP